MFFLFCWQLVVLIERHVEHSIITYIVTKFLTPRLEKKSDDGSTFLSAKEIFSIRERTFGPSAEKKNSRDDSTFLSAKEIFSIRERTFDLWLKKKFSRRLNFSIGDSYSRKNFWHLSAKKKSRRQLNFSIGERKNLYSRKNF